MRTETARKASWGGIVQQTRIAPRQIPLKTDTAGCRTWKVCLGSSQVPLRIQAFQVPRGPRQVPLWIQAEVRGIEQKNIDIVKK